jgi:uncharacterized protein YceK
VHKKTLLLLLSFAVVLDFSGCSSMSAQARRERAYRHSIAKQMKQHKRAMARAQKVANRQLKQKMKSAGTSEPQVTSNVESVPAAWSEPMTPPVTVSASDAIANQRDNQPAQP